MNPPAGESPQAPLILGEYRRLLDDRFRFSVPAELIASWAGDKSDYVLAKECPGCISLWRSGQWHDQLDDGIRIIQSKLLAGRLGHRLADVQALGRLLSTRHRKVQLGGRGRLAIPGGYREFLGVEPGTELIVVGAAVCIEVWRVDAWQACLSEEIPRFSSLLEELSR